MLRWHLLLVLGRVHYIQHEWILKFQFLDQNHGKQDNDKNTKANSSHYKELEIFENRNFVLLPFKVINSSDIINKQEIRVVRDGLDNFIRIKHVKFN